MTIGKMGARPLVKSWTARDYVQDGLIAMWDGIENAGWGTHDANAQYWTDLMRPNSVDKLSASGSWGNDYLSLTVSSTLPGTYFADASPTNHTFEFCFSIPEVKQSEGYILCWHSAGSGPFSINTAWGYLRFTGGGTGDYGNDNASYNLKPYLGSRFNGQFSVLFTLDQLYAFGEIARQDFPVAASTSTAHRFVIASAGQGIIEYNSIRIYNRSLTADEIAHNYAVDKLRFNLP